MNAVKVFAIVVSCRGHPGSVAHSLGAGPKNVLPETGWDRHLHTECVRGLHTGTECTEICILAADSSKAIQSGQGKPPTKIALSPYSVPR